MIHVKALPYQMRKGNLVQAGIPLCRIYRPALMIIKTGDCLGRNLETTTSDGLNTFVQRRNFSWKSRTTSSKRLETCGMAKPINNGEVTNRGIILTAMESLIL